MQSFCVDYTHTGTTMRLVESLTENACNYFPLSFSWLLHKLNRLNPYPAIHFGSSKCAGGRSAAAEEPQQACAGSSAWAGGPEGRSVSGLFNQLSTAQQGPTEIRANRLVFFKLTFNFSIYFLQTVAAFKESTSCDAGSKGHAGL